MLKLDQIDTPPAIARQVVESVSSREQEIIADFSVGGGALLEYAALRWPTAHPLGIDISRARIKALRGVRPDWILGSADFLNHSSRAQCHALKNMKQRVSLVLLNPPFSCRGARTRNVRVGNEAIASSIAMSFVLQSLYYLQPAGEMVAILPAGVMLSEKDAGAIACLRTNFSVEIVKACSHKSFEGLFVRTVIVHISPKVLAAQKTCSLDRASRPEIDPDVKIVRGSAPMHALKLDGGPSSVPLVHTTELVDNKLRHGNHRVSQCRVAKGPMVLIPRVGEPNVRKVVLVDYEYSAVLSDCVIALQCAHPEHAVSLYSSIVEHWPTLNRFYGGTCAKYITINNVACFLEEIGFRATSHDPMSYRNDRDVSPLRLEMVS